MRSEQIKRRADALIQPAVAKAKPRQQQAERRPSRSYGEKGQADCEEFLWKIEAQRESEIFAEYDRRIENAEAMRRVRRVRGDG